jgi:hypothetical protein
MSNLFEVCDSLGIIVNEERNEARAKKEYIFLGILFNHKEKSVGLSDKTREKIRECQKFLFSDHALPTRVWWSCFGVAIWASSVLRMPKFRFYYVYKFIRRTAKDHPDSHRAIWKSVVRLWAMWFDELLSAPNRIVYLHKESDTVLVSDSSKSGFGALLFSEAEVRVVAGAWSAKCRDLHINVLEMRAARLAIRMFSLEKVEISLVLDNTTALQVLKKERSRSFMMNKEVGMFIEEMTLRRVTITSLSYIDSKGNPADYWSRICENQLSHPIILRFPTTSTTS